MGERLNLRADDAEGWGIPLPGDDPEAQPVITKDDYIEYLIRRAERAEREAAKAWAKYFRLLTDLLGVMKP